MTEDGKKIIANVNIATDLLEQFNKIAKTMLEEYPALIIQKLASDNKDDSLWIDAELRFEKAAVNAREILR